MCSVIDVTDIRQKSPILLTYIGDEAYKTYENVVDQNTEATLDDVIQAFDKHFKTQLNASHDTFLFRQIKPLHDEDAHQSYIRIKEQTVKCEFHGIDLAIKQQKVLVINNNKLRRYSF